MDPLNIDELNIEDEVDIEFNIEPSGEDNVDLSLCFVNNKKYMCAYNEKAYGGSMTANWRSHH